MYRKTSGTDRSILIVPGFSESITHCIPLVDKLTEQGRYDVCTFSRPRNVSKSHPLDRQRDIILQVMDSMFGSDKKISGIAHSLGSLSLLRAAATYPERFSSLILMQPSGLTSAQSLFRIAMKASRKIGRNHFVVKKSSTLLTTSQRHVLLSQLSSAKTIIRNPRLAIREADVARSYSLSEDLAAIHSYGTPVYIMRSRSDELFDNDDSIIFDPAISYGSYSTFNCRFLGHDTFWTHPQLTAETVDTLISKKND